MGPCRDGPQVRCGHDIPFRNRLYNPQFGPLPAQFSTHPQDDALSSAIRNAVRPSSYSSISRRALYCGPFQSLF